MAKLKVAGTWGGILEVELENWTLRMLRDEVAQRSGLDPESIKLIFAGKILKDDGDNTKTLAQLGIKENSKILSSRGVAPEESKSIMAEEERSRRLSRVKAAATALSKRHADGSLPIEDYNIELEDQGGHTVKFGTETDQSAVMMGLMLHTKGKSLMEKEMYSDAVEVLAMAEESFLLCDPKILELVDNIPIMEIDIVWCYFLLRDIKCLSDASVRLEKARKGLERAHGKDLSRVRLLQAGQCPELALYVRLELLEGVVAYHTGQNDKAMKSLKSAHAKLLQLQISDETLFLVMSMGFQAKDAKRALRLNNQDIASSVDFLMEERTKRAQKHKDDLQRQKDILEQKTYGVTPMKKAVDMKMLERLVLIGYARDLAAESLRRHENDFQKALDALTSPEDNSKIQLYIESRKRKRQEQIVGVNLLHRSVLIIINMARSLLVSLTLAFLFTGMVSARDWNILNQFKGVKPATTTSQNTVSLKGPNLNGYCESWRVNVELHNIRDFTVVPQECVWFVQKYMTSSQYEDDVERAIDEAVLYLGKTCCEKKKCDGMDAWIFDIDDTLLSTIPYHKSNGCFGGEQLNTTKFEEWQSWGKAPALPNMVKLFHDIRERGFKIFLVSSRKEYLRSATVENLIEAGYHGWSNLLLRGEEDEKKSVTQYKADVRSWLTSLGYRVWGVMGAQWNSFAGCPVPKRTFKLPNSIYYIA